MYHRDKTHEEVDRIIEELETLKPKVILGFAIYWTLLAIATVIWVFTYLVPTIKGWF